MDTRTRTREDEFPHQRGSVERDHLCRAAAHGKPEEVDLRDVERVDEGDEGGCPACKGCGDGAAAAADAGAVEDYDGAGRCEGVDEGGVPGVHVAAEVDVEDEGDAGWGAEAAVG